MSSLLKIGAKSPSGKGLPLNLDENGNLRVGGPVTLAGVATSNLQIMTDNQGRIYGSPDDGLTWKAVKVNPSGQLELAQNVVIDNVTVNVGAEVKVNNDATSPVPVQVSGNNVEIVKIFDAVAITTTSNVSSNLISLNRYKTGTFVLYHTLGVELTLYPQFGSTLNSFILVNGEWKSTQAAPITIPPMSSEGRMMLNTHPTYKDVLSSGLPSVRFVVNAKTAPTSGSLTLEYWGSIR